MLMRRADDDNCLVIFPLDQTIGMSRHLPGINIPCMGGDESQDLSGRKSVWLDVLEESINLAGKSVCVTIIITFSRNRLSCSLWPDEEDTDKERKKRQPYFFSHFSVSLMRDTGRIYKENREKSNWIRPNFVDIPGSGLIKVLKGRT